ncbi:dehydrogenase [Virgibacillus indicus]|uniref:Dehydrogenase n=1 Tax=Virgibacillus indicus TaxID=2024554 RepID=A0A265N933_9BACI|nr:Gfo/Idh/MocA family oxidoreductase [Virgibacillus indicus]OZU88321.1 dehydrogenase [Virgibacillus indicus]
MHADDYAREAAANEELAVKLIWDEDSERGMEWAAELDVPFEEDLQAVLSNPEIDAVIVTTPTSMHKEVILEAAKHGKHIFTEKVLGFTLEDCEEMWEATEASGVELMVSLPRLSDRAYLHAEKSLREGLLGELTMIRCRMAHNGAVPMEGKNHGWLPERFFRSEETGGGALIDLGAHPIYLTNRLAGEAEAVYARLRKQVSSEVDDSAAVIVEYKSGALGVIETGFLSHGSPFQLELYGTEGTLLVEDESIKVKSVHLNNGEWQQLEESVAELPMPMEQWVAKIISGAEPYITKEDIFLLTLINEAAAHSHETGRRIELKDYFG